MWTKLKWTKQKVAKQQLNNEQKVRQEGPVIIMEILIFPPPTSSCTILLKVWYTLHLFCILHLNLLVEGALKVWVEFADIATVT